MIYNQNNFSGQVPVCNDGDQFIGCNLAQIRQTNIGLNAKGDPCKGLVFKDCNLVNCLLPNDAKVEGCNTAQLSYCSRLFPELIQFGLPVCGVNCQHVTNPIAQWQPATVEEFRTLKADILKASSVRVSNTVDSVGVVTQRFEKLDVVREHKYLGKWTDKGIVDLRGS